MMPSMECGDSKWARPDLTLLTSMMMKPARRRIAPTLLSVACIRVPRRFWSAVWVGWRIRAACVMRRMPDEFSSWYDALMNDPTLEDVQ